MKGLSKIPLYSISNLIFTFWICSQVNVQLIEIDYSLIIYIDKIIKNKWNNEMKE